MVPFHIDPSVPFSIDTLASLLAKPHSLHLSTKAISAINTCRAYVESKILSSKTPVYGINTGFGSLCNKTIENADLALLQHNLVCSHACGLGAHVPLPIVKLMLLLKIQALAYGHSGITLETVERLLSFYNNDVLPVVFNQGSLGASGDLVPLAHLSLPLLGLGEVHYKGEIRPAADVLAQLGLQPLQLASKEGLALLNGTQFMLAYGLYDVIRAQQLCRIANVTAALSIDAFSARLDPFHPLVQAVRPHPGQVAVAKDILLLLNGSALAQTPKAQVQDPYSFRCVPQVHGATLDALDYVARVMETELNAVTDNPLVFPNEDIIISGGNFHGQPLALALDMLAICMAEIGNISERRTYQLISGQRQLPEFLIADGGLNSGLMIPQYVAASLVSQNKQYCTPASVDSIVSSNGQEDHVSMGANAATKAHAVLDNVHQILAIEWQAAAQAMHFRRPSTTSDVLEAHLSAYNKVNAVIEKDRLTYLDINRAALFIHSLATK